MLSIDLRHALVPLKAAAPKKKKQLEEVVSQNVLKFLAKTDLKAIGCASWLYRNLIIAYRAMTHVITQDVTVDNNVEFIGREGETRLQANEQTMKMRRDFYLIFNKQFQRGYNGPWLTHEIVDEPSDLMRRHKMIDACARHWKRARCDEMASMSMVYIHRYVTQKVFLSRYVVKSNDPNSGHVIAWIGGDKHGAMCDAWSSEVYPFKYRSQYVKNYVATYDKPILTKFDPSKHQESSTIIWEPPQEPIPSTQNTKSTLPPA